jgi:putative PIG3 family NAD(P)H quinone oxidoreductase
MRAIVCRGAGGVEVLAMDEVPRPEPGPGQLLIRVGAAALNRADTLQRRGEYPPPPGESDILGVEVAGEVAALGTGVTGFAPGQRVFGLVPGGGYAELCLMDAEMALPVPAGWTFAEAAAVPEAFLTAHIVLCELAGLTAGESVLVHAGGSGVGTACIQLARELGARVFCTVGSEEKLARALALGAEAGVDHRTRDFAREVPRLTGGDGVDVVVDFLGAEALERNLAVLRPEGRLLLVGVLTGTRCELDLDPLLLKRLRVLGTVLRGRPLEQRRAFNRRFAERWLPLLAGGRLRPVIDSIHPWEQVARAHEILEANRNFGKILLSMETRNDA